MDFNDIKDTYNSSKHPDVLSGKRTHKEVLLEFLETFDVGGEVDGKVTPQEFENYYANISASIDNDDYFELMLRNAWHISGGEGWAANSANRRVLVTRSDGTQAVEEIEDDLGLAADDREGMVARLRQQGTNAAQVELFGEVGDGSSRSRGAKGASASLRAAATRRNVVVNGRSVNVGSDNQTASSSFGAKSFRRSASTQGPPRVSSVSAVNAEHPVVVQLKHQLVSRGAVGMVAIYRALRRMDTNDTKTLSFEQFSQAMIESGVKIAQPQLRQLFVFFDKDHRGCIAYQDLLSALRVRLSLYAFVPCNFGVIREGKSKRPKAETSENGIQKTNKQCHRPFRRSACDIYV